MVYLSKQKSLFICKCFANNSPINGRSTCNLFNKINMHWYLCKADWNPFKSSKMFDSNSSKISALHFKMSLAWDSLANSWHSVALHDHQIYKILSFLSKTTSSVSTPYFIQNQLKFTEFSIPNTPGIIIVNVFWLIGKQSLSAKCTCMYTCWVTCNWPIIGLSVSVYPQVHINLIGLWLCLQN